MLHNIFVKLREHKFFFALLAIITLLKIGFINLFSVGGDELISLTFSGIPIKDLLFTNYAYFWDQHPQTYNVLLKFLWYFFDNNYHFYRLSSIVFSTIALLFCYFSFLPKVGKKLSFLIMVLVSTNTLLLDQSLYIRNYAMYFMFIMGSYYFLEKWLKSNDYKNGLFSAIFVFFALVSHFFSILFYLVYGSYILFEIFKNKKIKEFFLQLFLPFFFICIPYYIMLFHFLSVLLMNVGSNEVGYFSFLMMVNRFFSVYINIFTGVFIRNIPFNEYLFEYLKNISFFTKMSFLFLTSFFIFSGLLAFWALYKLVIGKPKDSWIWVVLFLLIIPVALPLVLRTRFTNAQFYPYLVPFMFLFMVWGVEQVKSNKTKKFIHLLLISINFIIFISYFLLPPSRFYQNYYYAYDYIIKNIQPNKKEAIVFYEGTWSVNTKRAIYVSDIAKYYFRNKKIDIPIFRTNFETIKDIFSNNEIEHVFFVMDSFNYGEKTKLYGRRYFNDDIIELVEEQGITFVKQDSFPKDRYASILVKVGKRHNETNREIYF